MSHNIILIGFMGVGKGTIARALMSETKMVGLDTDDLIESMENRKIKTIFELEGEEYFRNIEKQTAKWLEKNVSKTIISTGGGFFKVSNLSKIGKVIYLKSTFEAILQRLHAHPNAEQKLIKRPLLNDLNKAKNLFDERMQQYEKKADIIIDVENKSIEHIVKEIIRKIK